MRQASYNTSGDPHLNLRGFVRLFTHIQLLPVLENGEETTLIGGQAVMEGVMMRSPHSYCVAVRKPTGEIVTEESPLAKISDRYPLFKWPILRGLGTLGGAMWLGMKALKFSADCALEALPGGAPKSEKKEAGRGAMALQIAFSLLFMIALYKFVPLYLATLLGHHFPAVSGRVAINAIDGGIRIAIFLGFMYLLSRMKEMHRLFEYHGAEHKVVFNFEAGQPLTVQNAQKFVTWHPRCGTSFLVVVLIVAMIGYLFLPIDNFWLKLAARIGLLPVIVGISYEIIRFAAKRRSGLMAILTQPGLWLQRVTTQAPSNEQAEVAICALERAMELEKAQGGQLVIA
ncbi:MAG TPA: DUF1385 domain-containing protein [Bryobacteraceae bacterium]|nr:DUF1385 domain-containing protein [Bryobacteraceae bacterium]